MAFLSVRGWGALVGCFVVAVEMGRPGVNVTSILEGEYAENEVRKDFTRSEQVAIAASLEELLANRQGERTDKSDTKLPENDPEVERGERTRDFIAKKVGLGTGRTYQQARDVVRDGTQELNNLGFRNPELNRSAKETRIRFPETTLPRKRYNPRSSIIKGSTSLPFTCPAWWAYQVVLASLP